jgi:hypothetical protein
MIYHGCYLKMKRLETSLRVCGMDRSVFRQFRLDRESGISRYSL